MAENKQIRETKKIQKPMVKKKYKARNELTNGTKKNMQARGTREEAPEQKNEAPEKGKYKSVSGALLC